MLLPFIFILIFGSQVSAKILLLAADRTTGFNSSISNAKTGLLETGLFESSDIDILSCLSSDPSLFQLTPYEVVLVWTNYQFQNPENVGNILKQYVDLGGKLVIATGCFSHRGYSSNDKCWQVEGGILNSGYCPFLPNNIQYVSGSLDLNSTTNPDHPIFSNINKAPIYWSNRNFSNPQLNAGGTLLAKDTNNNNLIAQNPSRNIIAINIFPSYLDRMGTNMEARLLVANAIIFVTGNFPEMSISPTSVNITASKNVITFNVNNISEGTMNWTAISNNSWIEMQSGASGTNNGLVSVFCKNNTGNARTGSITIRANKTLNSPQTFYINQSANTYPTISAISDQSINEDITTNTIYFTINDAETPETLTLRTRSSNYRIVPVRNITIGGSGSNRWLQISPARDQFGTVTISVDVSDGTLSSLTSFSLTVNPVNDVPVFVKGGDQIHSEDDGSINVNHWALGIAAGPSNESNQSIAFMTSTNNDSLFTTIPQINTYGTLTYQLAPDAYGTALVSVYLKDNGGVSNGGIDTSTIQQFSINVVAVNDAPVFTKGPNLEVLEDAPLQTLQWATDISAGPNETHQALTFYVTADKNELFAELPLITPDGILSYRPAPDMNGTTIVEVFLKDDGTRKRTVGDTSEKQYFSITIKPVNDDPSFSVSDITILEDSGPQTFTNNVYNISTGPQNESDQFISFNVTSNNEGLFIQQPAISPEGTLTFETTPDTNGMAELSIYAVDDGGTDDNGNDTSETKILTLAVTPVNDPPAFTQGQSQYIIEDAQPQEVLSWARDIVPGPQNEVDQLVSFIVTNDNPDLFSEQPAISPDGKLTYSVVPETGGLANVEVRLTDDGGTDNNGINYSEVETFKIVVREINDSPVFVKGEDQVIDKVDSVTAGKIVENWATNISPGANESYQRVKFNVNTDNESLFIQPPLITENGTLMYTPAANMNGRARCTVTLEDDSSYAIDDDIEGTYISLPQEFMITVGDSNKFSLKVTADGCGGDVEVSVNGVTQISPYYQDLNYGDAISLLAVPSENCTFVSWSDTIVSNPRYFTITENKTIVGYFGNKEVKSLMVNNIGDGRIVVNDSTCTDSPCRYSFFENSLINLEAIPNNYLTVFDSWSGIESLPNRIIQFRIHNNMTIDAHFSQPTGVWASVLKVEGEDYGALHTGEVTLGVGVENISEATSVTDLFSCSISIVGLDGDNQLLIQQYGQKSFNWSIAVNPYGTVGPSGDRTVKLTWDPSFFDANGLYQLREGIGNSGNIVIANMKNMNEFWITGNNALQYFTITYTEFLEYEFNLNKGWNLISIPVFPENSDLNALFEDAEIAYCFIGGEYVSVNVLQPAIGYWLKVPADNTYFIRGTRFFDHLYQFKSGWQLIGPTFKEQTTIIHDDISVIYKYNGEYYEPVNELEPGFGYWIKAINDFSITIDN